MPHLSALSLALNRPGAVSLEQVVASLFASGEQGAWYDPSAANVTWRRNLVTYTENFTNSNAQWPTVLGVTVTADQAVAPDGQSTADSILEDGGNTKHSITRVTTAVGATGVRYCWSMHVKRVSGTRNLILYNFGFNNAAARFDFTAKTATLTNSGTAATCDIQELSNGWFRIYLSDIATSTQQGIYVGLLSGTAETYQGNSTDGFYAWGFQYELGSTPTAYQRIVTPEITYLADVQSQPLLFQDSTGATPVTAVEQPVGLILDKRKGLVLGPELVTNGDFATDTVWDKLTGWAISGGVATHSGGVTGVIRQTVSITAGKWYKLTVTVSGRTASQLNIQLGSGSTQRVIDANGTYDVYLLAGASDSYLSFNAVTTFDGSIDNVTLKLLDGNHAYQTGSTARPVLRARYNLLTYSEQFDNAFWLKVRVQAFGSGSLANAIASPDGTSTADLLVEDATPSNNHFIFSSNIACVSGAQYTFTVYAKAKERSYIGLRPAVEASGTSECVFNLNNGTVSSQGASATNAQITSVGNGWYRCSVTATCGATENKLFYIFIANNSGALSYSGDGTSGLYVWGADLRVGTSAGDYQRIAAATDYATTSTITGQPFRPYLEQPTGGDDSLIVANSSFNDFAASDAPFFMSAGVTRYGTTRGTIFCLANNTNATAGNNDTLNLEADSTAQVRGYLLDYDAGGNTEASATAGTLAAEATFIASWQRTATDGFARNNGTAGTGVDQTAPAVALPLATVFAQRRGTSPTTDQRFTGRMFGLIVRAGTLTAGQMSAVETYLAGKSGVTL